MDIVTTLATVPAVIALVTLAKDLGLPTRLSPLLAVVLGVVVSLFDLFATGSVLGTQSVLQTVGTGVILGLSASGLYDGARVLSPKTQDTIVVEENPTTKPSGN